MLPNVHVIRCTRLNSQRIEVAEQHSYLVSRGQTAFFLLCPTQTRKKKGGLAKQDYNSYLGIMLNNHYPGPHTSPPGKIAAKGELKWNAGRHTDGFSAIDVSHLAIP